MTVPRLLHLDRDRLVQLPAPDCCAIEPEALGETLAFCRLLTTHLPFVCLELPARAGRHVRLCWLHDGAASAAPRQRQAGAAACTSTAAQQEPEALGEPLTFCSSLTTHLPCVGLELPAPTGWYLRLRWLHDGAAPAAPRRRQAGAAAGTLLLRTTNAGPLANCSHSVDHSLLKHLPCFCV
jgi:hypothetical protein